MGTAENHLTIPDQISFSPEQVSEIRVLLSAMARERTTHHLKRAIVLLAFSLDQQRANYEPVRSHSGMNKAFEALIGDLSIEKPETDEAYVSIANVILQNAFLRLQSGELSIEKFMEAVHAVGQIY